VALTPQPLAPQFFEPPVQSEPLRGLWTAVVAGILLVFGAIGEVLKQIAARWRGIILTHIFFLTLWLAVQVFFFATGAYWCLPNENSKIAEWFSKLVPQVARCGPVLSVHGSLPSSGPVAVSSVASMKASSSPSASPRSGAASSLPAASPSDSPATPSSAPSATSSPGSAAGWSARSVANCWRDRSVNSNCYGRTEAHRRLPPARSRYPAYPCRRPSECGWDAI
jgi:hypothetical protein